MDNPKTKNRPKLVGHHLVGSKPDVMDANTLYDVEEWTTIGGGTYVCTVGINVSKEEALKIYDKYEDRANKWRKNTNAWLPWCDHVRVVEHDPDRVYFAIDHEGFADSGIYDMHKEKAATMYVELMSNLHNVIGDDELIYSNRQLQTILKDRIKCLLSYIENNILTTVTDKNKFKTFTNDSLNILKFWRVGSGIVKKVEDGD